jgi:hypothetical protein
MNNEKAIKCIVCGGGHDSEDVEAKVQHMLSNHLVEVLACDRIQDARDVRYAGYPTTPPSDGCRQYQAPDSRWREFVKMNNMPADMPYGPYPTAASGK